jgi:hypothetical protein
MLLLTVTAVSLPAAAASAARPITFRDAGVRLHWPASGTQATVQPGTRLRIGVRSLRRGSARVTVALTRLPGGRVVTRRSLRRGTVTLRLPAPTGVRYRLSASAGRRLLRRTTLVVPAPARTRAGDQPTDQASRQCAEGPASGTLVGDKRALHYGETLALTFTKRARPPASSAAPTSRSSGCWSRAGSVGSCSASAASPSPRSR